MKKNYWYLDITPNEMFSLYDYPIQGKDGLPPHAEYILSY
jgi:hypothetical protein